MSLASDLMETKTVLNEKVFKNINEMSKVRKMEQRLFFFSVRLYLSLSSNTFFFYTAKSKKRTDSAREITASSTRSIHFVESRK